MREKNENRLTAFEAAAREHDIGSVQAALVVVAAVGQAAARADIMELNTAQRQVPPTQRVPVESRYDVMSATR